MKIIAVEPIGMSSAQMSFYEKQFARMGHQFIWFPDRKEDPEILIQRMRYADVVIISNIRLDSKTIAACTNLKMLAVAYNGLDHIDTEYCEEQGIPVYNASGYARHAVAELALGLMISLYRQINVMDSITRKGGTRGDFLGRQIHGKTVGVVGIGGIGKVVARNLQALGCNIIAWGRREDEEVKKMGVEYVDLDALMSTADIVTLHLPLTQATENLISADRINLMKSSAILINTARGKIVDIPALALALKEKRIAGAAFDVFEIEPPLPQSHPLLNAPNCIVVPHIAYATQEAFELRIEIVMEKVMKWLENNR
ncbi:NAD(P)-binding domain-containing protein [Bacteroidales bacterium OttesenSCG-928-B11]|nr:NAD(P)-binding domain-containing protein [Bacteroidales bacterium OttesenSCG-928-E04]MDL2312419.1 NAD(P)-binding domain-containing protein [Bacteroidales bacterium OttesenSCG-928-B11]MDL2326322.1 NAD(P)-binding domain-containing protein [Bacteroidales bacterium OttesenSCG-928-A14]